MVGGKEGRRRVVNAREIEGRSIWRGREGKTEGGMEGRKGRRKEVPGYLNIS